MPLRVPSLDGRPVFQNPVQQGNVPAADQSLAIVGAQLQQTGNTIRREGAQALRVGQAFIDQADDARSSQQATLHADALDKLVRGYQNRLAADAHDGYEPLNKQIAKLRDRFSNKLTNSRQAVLYKTKVDAQLRRARGLVDRHFAHQTRAWNIEQTEVSLNQHAQDYADAALLGDEHDDEREHRMTVARGVMEKQFDKLSELSGMDAKTAKALKAQRLAKLHNRTLNMLADASPEQAADYLEAFSDEMDPATRTKAQKVVDAATLQDKALATARSLMGSAGANATPSERMQAVLDGASKITDADEFRAVMTFATAETTRLERVDAMQKNELMDKAEELIFGEGGEFLTFEQLPPTLQTDLRNNGLVDETYAIMGRRDRVTQQRVLQRILQNPEILKGIPPEQFKRTYAPALSKSAFETAEALHAQQNGIATGKPVTDMATHKDAFAAVMRSFELDADSIEGNDQKTQQAEQMMEHFQSLIDAGKVTKDMSYQDVKQLLNDEFRETATILGTFWNDTVPAIGAPASAVMTVTTQDGRQEQLSVYAIPDTVSPGAGDVGVRTWLRQTVSDLRGGGPVSNHDLLQAWVELKKPKTVREAQQANRQNVPYNRTDKLTPDDVKQWAGMHFNGVRLSTWGDMTKVRASTLPTMLMPDDWDDTKKKQAHEYYEVLKRFPSRADSAIHPAFRR